MFRLFHIKHSWHRFNYFLHHNSKIYREERLCKCGRNEIHIGQFKDRVVHKIEEKLGKKEWYPYTHGDWLDLYTQYIIDGKLDE